MPPKKQQKSAETSSTPTGRKNPDNVWFLKFRCDPKPSFRLQSGNKMTLLYNRLRTSMHDPDEALPVAAAEDDKGKVKGIQVKKVRDESMVNIEILFKNIEQVDVVASDPAAPGKTIVIHTKEPVESVKGHVLSRIIVFYFSALSNKVLEGGRGGVEDYMKLWESLESRGVDVVVASSSSDSLQEEEGEPTGTDDEDGMGSNVDFIVTPTPSKRRKRAIPKTPKSKGATPFEEPVSGPASTGTSLLDGEMIISSSQPRRRPGPALRRLMEEMSVNEDDEEVEEQILPPRKRKKIIAKGAKAAEQEEAVSQRPEVRELKACLDAIKMQVVENWIDSVNRDAVDRKHLNSKLWKEVRRGLEKTGEESLVLAGHFKKNEAKFRLHSKQYRLVISQGEENMAFFLTKIKEALKTITDQRGRLVRFKMPFETM